MHKLLWMAVTGLWWGVGAFLFHPSSAAATPFPVKNHSPVFLGLLYPAADMPDTLSGGDVSAQADVHYSSIFFQDLNPGWDYLFDMEVAQLTFGLRQGFGPFEGGLEVPLFYFGGGFLDQAILDCHQKLGFVDYAGQRDAPRNRYLYTAIHNGKRWNAPLPYTVALGDVTVWMKRELLVGESGALAAKFLAQAPSAAGETGMGNGAWEYGLMLIGGGRLSGVELSLNAGAVHPGFIDRGDRLTLNPIYLFDVSAEHFFTKRLSAVAQFSYASSPYGADGPDLFRRTWQAVTVGGRYTAASGRVFSLSFTEDLSQTAPDFTLGFGFGF